MINILLCDDHAVVRMGLTMLLNNHPDMEVIGEASEGNEAIQKAHEEIAPMFFGKRIGIEDACATIRTWLTSRTLASTTDNTPRSVARAPGRSVRRSRTAR